MTLHKPSYFSEHPFHCYKTERTLPVSRQLYRSYENTDVEEPSVDCSHLDIEGSIFLTASAVTIIKSCTNSSGNGLLKVDREKTFTLKAILGFSMETTHLFKLI